MPADYPRVRLTGLLIEDGCLLVIEEVLRERRHWTLPGGCLEMGEPIGAGLVREIKEETGLDVEVGELLYVTDRLRSLGRQTVDLCFLVHRTGGELLSGDHVAPDGERIRHAIMVPAVNLHKLGLGSKLGELIAAGFPQKGSYQGDFHELYG